VNTEFKLSFTSPSIEELASSEGMVTSLLKAHSPLMSEHPTASWEAMQDGNVFYRRQQLYSIAGKLPNLGDYIVAGCRYGGPLGFLLLLV